MQITREEIDGKANPFLIVDRQIQDLGSLVLEPINNRIDVVRVLRGNKCRTKQGLFDEISAALQFPYYFGENWDAFSECINDLSWLPADSYLLVVTNAEQLLSHESHEEFEKFIRIMERTAKNWNSGRNHARNVQVTKEESNTEKNGFIVVFQCLPNDGLRDPDNWMNKANIPKLGDPKRL